MQSENTEKTFYKKSIQQLAIYLEKAKLAIDWSYIVLNLCFQEL
jgi:hypothetical protein